MTLAFYPRGGSAQVVRYLGGALETLGHAVTVCCGSLGPKGSSSHAATFFSGLDVQALDFTEAAAWFERGLKDPSACVRMETCARLGDVDAADLAVWASPASYLPARGRVGSDTAGGSP